ncbi:unnamed protein product [Ophioblennius macclurei]
MRREEKRDLGSSCVKIYLCSNPEDSVVERRALRESVFPRLREQCRRSTGLEVRLIDPFESSDRGRWPDQSSRQQLIRDCREESAGPFLLALIGHQYGAAGGGSLPARLEVSEFQLLLHGLQRVGVATQDLEAEYRRDENSVPASFCRNPLQDGNEKVGEDEDLRRKFLSAVTLNVTVGLMSPERGRIFFRSALDADLRFALDDCPDENLAGRCLIYVNKVVNAEGGGAKEQLQPHVEPLIPDAAPPDGDLLLSDLRDAFLPAAVAARHLLVYTSTTVCDPRHGYTATRRRGYAESLSQQAYADLLRLTESPDAPEVKGDALRREGGEQREMCRFLSGLYEVVMPEEEQIRDYLMQKDQQGPLVVTGGPCTGKTVLVARCTQQIKSWSSLIDPVVVSYLCNLSTDASPRRLLSGLCSRIADGYLDSSSGLEPSSRPPVDLSELHSLLLKPDFSSSEVKGLLWSLLTLLPSKNRPLVLLLDGLDQLEDGVGPQVVHSLPSPVPPHVKLVLTASSFRTRLLHAVARRFHDGAVRLGAPDRKRCVKMLEALLRRSGRKVTSGQQAVVNRALGRCRLPLYVRLLHEITALWRSDSDVGDSSLPDGVHSSISALLDLLARKHGSSLVERVVSVLALARAGLSESELADLSEATPVDLQRLLLDLRSFLLPRTSGGSKVLLWASRHFRMVVEKRFLGSEEVRRRIHGEMADYFNQPSFVGAAAQQNLRKVVELPHHLQQSGRFEDLERGVFMSFDFHQAAVLVGLVSDLVAALESSEFSREKLLLASVLTSAACFLQSSPQQLSAVMESELLPYLDVFPALKSYVRDVRLEKTRRGIGLGISLCPSPSSVPPIQRLKHGDKMKDLRVLATAAAAESEIVAELLSDGSVWIRKSCGAAFTKLTLTSEKENEIKFAGVKMSGGFLLLSTQCGKHFVCDVAANPETFQEIKESGKMTNGIQGFVVCRKKLLIWWKDERFVSVFDLQSENTARFRCRNAVTFVAASSDHCFCGQQDGIISVFDVESGVPIGSCSNPNGSEIASIILSEDGGEMASVDRSGNVALWDVAAERLVKENCGRDESDGILNTDYSAENEALLLCRSDCVQLYDTSEWELWEEFSAPRGHAFSGALLSADGHLLLALLENCRLVLAWRIGSGECVLSLETGTAPHTLLRTAAEVVCVAHDGGLTAWDSEMIAAAVGTAPKMKNGVKTIVVDAKGKWFYSADGSERAWRWRLDSRRPHAHFLHDGGVEQLQLSPDGVHLVALAAGVIYVWRAASGDNVARIGGSRASRILVTPNSRFGVSVSERGPTRVWRLAAQGGGAVVCSIHLHLADAQVSPEGTFLIGRRRGDLLAASLWSGAVSKRFSCVASAESVAAFQPLARHPDYVLVLTASGALYTWKVAEETAFRHFRLPQTFLCRPRDFQMSADGAVALLAADGDAVNLLDLSRVRLCSFRTDGPVLKARLDPNGRFAVFASQPEKDCACFLHSRPVLTAVRLSDGETIGRVCLPKNPSALAVRGQHVFVGLEDGAVAVYSVSNDVPADEDEGESNNRGVKLCPFEKNATCWFPRVAASVTWP